MLCVLPSARAVTSSTIQAEESFGQLYRTGASERMKGATFVATICLMLTATAEGLSNKKKRKKVNESVMERMRACQAGPCGHLVPLEAKNCVNECVSSSCYKKVFAEPLEDGEVNVPLSKNFMSCARKDIQTSTTSQKRSDRQTISVSEKSAASATGSFGRSVQENVENVVVLVDGSIVQENEADAESDYNDGLGNPEDGEGDDGFEESSDEGSRDSKELDGNQLGVRVN